MSTITRTAWEIEIERRVERIRDEAEAWNGTTNRCCCCRAIGVTGFHGHRAHGQPVQTTLTVHREGCDLIHLDTLVGRLEVAEEGSEHEARIYGLLNVLSGYVAQALDRAMFL